MVKLWKIDYVQRLEINIQNQQKEKVFKKLRPQSKNMPYQKHYV